jgi:prepilin-type N-terminal cleavage/methylation domain-containing protein
MKSPAFSLVEVLAAITIIGIIVFLAIPNIIRVKEDGEDNLARARAETLNMAIASYVQANGGSAAQSAWSSAGSESARYDLLRGYMAFSEVNWTNYMPSGYGVTNWPTTVNPPDRRLQATKGGSALP